MFQVKIKNVASGQYSHGGQFQSLVEAQAWIDSHLAKGMKCSWGKPEHTIQVELSPAVYDENNILISIAVVEDQIIPSEFIVEGPVDISAQIAQELINSEALAYLSSTDWLIIREIDEGTPCPIEIKVERAAARARIVR